MKKNSRLLPILFLALTVLVAACAAWNLYTQPTTEPGVVLIHQGDHTYELYKNKLSPASLHFDVTNAKGETRAIDAPGVSLDYALRAVGISTDEINSVTITAADAYSATVSNDEIRADAAWLIISDDNTFRLIVPTDPDSRRNVSNVQTIDIH